jgi:hypothetical protein
MENDLLFKLKDIETNLKAISKAIEKAGDVCLACIQYHDSMIALSEAIHRQSTSLPNLIDMIAKE